MTMLKNEKGYSNRRMMRMALIMVLYSFFLFDEEIDDKKIFEDDLLNELFNFNKIKKNQEQCCSEITQSISEIRNNILDYQTKIEKYIDPSWSWKRINPVVKSILVSAINELSKLEIGIVANEYVEIAKLFVPDQTYRFVNVVIQSIWKDKNENK